MQSIPSTTVGPSARSPALPTAPTPPSRDHLHAPLAAQLPARPDEVGIRGGDASTPSTTVGRRRAPPRAPSRGGGRPSSTRAPRGRAPRRPLSGPGPGSRPAAPRSRRPSSRARRRWRGSGPIPSRAARPRPARRSAPRHRRRPRRGSASRRWRAARGRRQPRRRGAVPGRPGGPRPAHRPRPAPSTSTRAPIASRTSSAPVRVGLTPTPRTVTAPSGAAAPATRKNAADEMSPGTRQRRPVRRRPGTTVTVDAVHLHVAAERRQHPLRVVAAPGGLDHGHRSGRRQPGQQHR